MRSVATKTNSEISDILHCCSSNYICRIEICDQEHQLNCAVMRRFLPELTSTTVKYTDIFGNVDKQLAAVKLFSKISKQREIIDENHSLD